MIDYPEVAETITTDNDGFMSDIVQWSREVAEELARRNYIVNDHLSDEHWKIIKYVHEYYLEYCTGPSINKIGRATGLSSKEICRLFPCGVARGAYRLAGLPRPPGCV